MTANSHGPQAGGEDCQLCEGSGDHPEGDEGLIRCPRCNGTGIEPDHARDLERAPEEEITCRHCARVYMREELEARELDAMEHGEPCPSDDCTGLDEAATEGEVQP